MRKRKKERKEKNNSTHLLFSLYIVVKSCHFAFSLSNKIPIIYAVKRKIYVLLAKDLKPILKCRLIKVKAISFLAGMETIIVHLK